MLSRILERFEEIKVEIVNYEDIREEALAKTDQYISKREQLIEEGKVEEADEMLQIAGTERRKALHSLVNIRFLALSSIGLYDMANRIYTGLEKPSKQQADQFDAIRSIYSGIDDAYIYEGDRERLEEKAEQKKGCLSLF